MNKIPTDPYPIKENREENWTNQKPEYYGFLIEKVIGDDVKVNTAYDHIPIRTPLGENGEKIVYTHILSLDTEEQAQTFLYIIQSLDLDEHQIIKDMEIPGVENE